MMPYEAQDMDLYDEGEYSKLEVIACSSILLGAVPLIVVGGVVVAGTYGVMYMYSRAKQYVFPETLPFLADD